MGKVIEILKNSWKLIVTIIGAIGILATFYNLSSSVVTAKDLDSAKKEVRVEIKEVDKNAQQSFKVLNDTIQFNSDVQRLKTLEDLSSQYEIMLYNDPKNKKLIKNKEKVDKEKDDVLNRITKPKETKTDIK